MTALSQLFERFLLERRLLKNVTPKTVVWYQTAFLAFTRTVAVAGPDDLNKSLLHDFVSSRGSTRRVRYPMCRDANPIALATSV